MDPFPGIEVGAEVELNDGFYAGEDLTAIRLENKVDLPLWQNLNYSDDSSSDESLDLYHDKPNPEHLKIQEMSNAASDRKSQVQVANQLVKNVSVFTSAGDAQPALLYVNEVPRDEFVGWSKTFNKGLQDQLYQPAPCYEESGISHVEVIPSIDFGHLPPSYSTEVYTKSISPYEEVSRESFGKYSYFNAKTQFSGSVKPWGKSHKCQQCGRQFGRLYNLENHKCIQMCLGSAEQHMVNLETMNRLEKMCAEAQKELQNLQGHYRKDNVGAPARVLEVSGASDTLVCGQKVLSDSVRCNSCGLQLESAFDIDHHVCKETFPQNIKSHENTFIINLAPSNVSNLEQVLASQPECISSELGPIEGERTYLIVNSGNNPVPNANGSNEANVFYKCLECGKMFDKRCSITNHLRWHAKERCFISSVGSTAVESDSLEVQGPDGSSQHVGYKKDCVIPSRPAHTFTCEYCGMVFDKNSSYVTHIFWHLKNEEPRVTSEIQEANNNVEQETFTLIREHESQRECPSPDKICTCQSCGRVFNKFCDLVSHTCGTTEEQEDQQGQMEAQVFLVADEEYLEEGNTMDMVDQVTMASDRDSSREEPSSCLENGNFQGYCNLVRQLSLEEQQKAEEHNMLPATTEPNQSQPPELLESIFELIVGSKEVQRMLSKGGHNQPKEEDSGKVEERDLYQAKPKFVPLAKQSPLPFIFPSAFVRELLKRPNPLHRCRDCGLHFHQTWRLKLHRFKALRKGCTLRKHQCDCGRTPFGSLHFLLHQLQHLRDTPFICAVCGKRLRGYHQLQAHSWVHRLASQFQCNCGARFTQLPRYLWHSLLNNAKARPKTHLRPQSALQAL